MTDYTNTVEKNGVTYTITLTKGHAGRLGNVPSMFIEVNGVDIEKVSLSTNRWETATPHEQRKAAMAKARALAQDTDACIAKFHAAIPERQAALNERLAYIREQIAELRAEEAKAAAELARLGKF